MTAPIVLSEIRTIHKVFSTATELLDWHQRRNYPDVRGACFGFSLVGASLEGVKQLTITYCPTASFNLRRDGNSLHVSILVVGSHDDIARLRARLDRGL